MPGLDLSVLRGPAKGDVRPRLVLGICCMSILIVALDNTIVNVALPSMGRDLHASVAGLQWTIDGYTLVIASLLMLSGSMADRLGRRRVFQVGLLLFTLGSLLCSLAPSLTLLVVFRMLQGIGGSMLNPVAMSIIRNTFEDPRERARAVGVWGSTVGVSLALGPVIGGVLVQSVGWRSIFWINIPIGLAAIALTARFVRESKAPRARRPDPLGQILIILLLGSVTYGIIEGPDRGWLDGEIVAAFLVAILSLGALLRSELRRPEPLIELRFFSSAPFSGAAAIAVIGFAAFGGFLFLNTLYLQDYRDLSALDAGLYTLPLAVMAMVCAPLAGRLVGQGRARVSLAVAGLGMTVGPLLLVGLDSSTPTALLVVAYVLFGCGFGFLNPPITATAISGMPPDQAGVAAAVASSSRQLGQTLGVAVVGAVAVGAATLPGGSLPRDFIHSSHVGWWLILGCGLTILAIGQLSTGARARASAARVAGALDAPGQSAGADDRRERETAAA